MQEIFLVTDYTPRKREAARRADEWLSRYQGVSENLRTLAVELAQREVEGRVVRTDQGETVSVFQLAKRAFGELLDELPEVRLADPKSGGDEREADAYPADADPESVEIDRLAQEETKTEWRDFGRKLDYLSAVKRAASKRTRR
jgi:hypothetical protein